MIFLQMAGIEYGVAGVALAAVGGAFWALVQRGISIWEKKDAEHTLSIQKLVDEKNDAHKEVLAFGERTVAAITEMIIVMKKCQKDE